MVALVIQENAVPTEAGAVWIRGWNKLVGLVVVGAKSPTVKAVGVLLGASPPADAGRGDAGEAACVLGEYH